jgi:transcriptional regulator with XRE-family HTH domain
MVELKRLRKARGLSQAKLAALADLDPSTVSQIETGARRANTRTLERLAVALGADVADLFPKGQAPLPLDTSADGADDPAEAAAMIKALADKAAKLATAWNRDVEFYEQHSRSLFPYRTFEMSCTVVVLYERFWGALATLQRHAESLGLDPNPATWQPESKDLLLEAGSNIRALAELYALIERAAADTRSSREDSRALREEFDVEAPARAPAFLTEDPQWPAAIERARTAAGIAS